MASFSLGGMFKKDKNNTTSSGYENTNTTTKLFNDEILSMLEGEFSSLLSGLGSGQASQLTDQLLAEVSRGSDIDVDAIMANARREAEIESGQNYQALARQAGSDANSLVALAQNEAIADRESQLAATEAELRAQARDDYINQVSGALDAANSVYEPILGLGELLRGANATENRETNYKNKIKSNSTSWGIGGSLGNKNV